MKNTLIIPSMERSVKSSREEEILEVAEYEKFAPKWIIRDTAHRRNVKTRQVDESRAKPPFSPSGRLLVVLDITTLILLRKFTR